MRPEVCRAPDVAATGCPECVSGGVRVRGARDGGGADGGDAVDSSPQGRNVQSVLDACVLLRGEGLRVSVDRLCFCRLATRDVWLTYSSSGCDSHALTAS